MKCRIQRNENNGMLYLYYGTGCCDSWVIHFDTIAKLGNPELLEISKALLPGASVEVELMLQAQPLELPTPKTKFLGIGN